MEQVYPDEVEKKPNYPYPGARLQNGRGHITKIHKEEIMSHTREMSSRTFLKPSEVASLFNVSLSTVYFWHRMQMIRGVKIGGCLRIYRGSLSEIFCA